MSLNSNTTTNNTNNEYNIYNFLDEHRVESGQPHTHTSMYNPKGSYHIKESELNRFYELYEDAIFKKYELNITEKHEEIAPIIIDLDFKYDIDTHERQHTEEHVVKIVSLYIDEICDVFNIEKNSEKLMCFVFERNETYKNKGVTKDGIHIMFPFIVSYPNVQYYIRDNILKKITDIIGNLNLKNVITDVVDRSVISPNTLWLLYGSNKDKPKGNPYQLKYIFNGNIEIIEPEDYFTNNVNLASFFSIRNKKQSDLVQIRDNKVELLQLNNNTYVKKLPSKSKSSNYINYDIEKIIQLVSLLSVDRAENYNQWIEVGWALHNIDSNSNELLDLWIEFSKKSSKFEEGQCEKQWHKSKNEGLTVATLHYWAKLDNYQKYIEFKNKCIDKFVDTSIKTQSNYDVANVLFKMYEYDFVYSNDDWYMYKNHKWNRESDGMSLRQKISNELCGVYLKIVSNHNKMSSNFDLPEEERAEHKKKSEKIFEIVKKLKTTSFKDNIMRECKELFSNKDFVEKLDANPFLMGFTNGVYDLNKLELRDGRPDDYIEMSTGIDKIDFDEDHECWNELKYFLETIFFEEDIRVYFLTYLATCLQGHNAEEKFRIWNGIGCHAYDTDIMMFNGTIKKVQDIITGDKLMGDDSTERNVIELKRGFSTMYKFYSDKNDFEDFIVNGNHILCLKTELYDKILEISVSEYLKLQNKENYYLYNEQNQLFQFNVVKVNNDSFYGFELDGNHRYKMGNGIITHNSNGKSKLIELFVHCMGKYAVKFPVTMLTGKRAESNACTPEMVRAKGCRFGYLEEPGQNEKLNVGYLKELTGGDKIVARALHKEQIDFKPQFKLALLCNEIPKVPSDDSGTWRRMEVIEFKSKFCENPKEPHEFPIDKHLSEKMKNWVELFMALLFDIYYIKYKKDGLKVPFEVIKFTMEYQKTCDLYSDFVTENIEDTRENTDSIDIIQIYDEFKIWYEDNFSTHKHPAKSEFRKYLQSKYGKRRVNQTDIKGFKFRIKYDKQTGKQIFPVNLIYQQPIKIQNEEKVIEHEVLPVEKVTQVKEQISSSLESNSMTGY